MARPATSMSAPPEPRPRAKPGTVVEPHEALPTLEEERDAGLIDEREYRELRAASDFWEELGDERAPMMTLSQMRRDPRFQRKLREQARAPLPVRPQGRAPRPATNGRRRGSRRVASTRAGPDDDPGEAEPPPSWRRTDDLLDVGLLDDEEPWR